MREDEEAAVESEDEEADERDCSGGTKLEVKLGDKGEGAGEDERRDEVDWDGAPPPRDEDDSEVSTGRGDGLSVDAVRFVPMKESQRRRTTLEAGAGSLGQACACCGRLRVRRPSDGSRSGPAKRTSRGS